VPVDAESPNLGLERRRRDPEPGRGSTGTGDTAVRGAEHLLDQGPFLIPQGAAKTRLRRRDFVLSAELLFLDTQHVAVAKDHGARSITFCSSRTFPGHA
jgi:hypothetical protein